MKKLFLVLAMFSLFIAACPKQPNAVEEPPPRPPEQMVVDPETGQDVTGEYLQAHLDDYWEARDRIFEEARKRIAAGESPQVVYDDLMARLEALQDKTDHAIKHIPRIGEVNVPEVFKQDRETLEDIIHSDCEY